MSCKGGGYGGGNGGCNVVGCIPPNIYVNFALSHNGIFAAGSNATYTISLTNVGNAAITGLITVYDNLPAGLTFISGTGAGWTCSATLLNGFNQRMDCTNPGPIAAGASANITLTVSVAANALGSIITVFDLFTPGDYNGGNGSSIDTAVLNGCAGSKSGNELVLKGQYALLAQGFLGSGAGSPVAMAASFTADGQGHITSGEEDLNNPTQAIILRQQLTIISADSLYTVGPDNRACVQLAYSGGYNIPATFRLVLGGISGGVASKGRIIEFDDNSGTGTRVSGIVRQQDATAFSVTQLKSNYALGGDGVDSAGRHVAIAGSINVATGGIQYDLDEGGPLGARCVGTGLITSLSGTTGRGLLTLTPGCAFLIPAHDALYVVNANEIFFIQIDQFAPGLQFGGGSAIISGRAVATGSSFSSSSLGGNYILHMTGQTGGAAHVSLALLTLTPDGGNTGTVTGTLFSYSQSGGASTTAVTSASYTADPASGRVTFSGLGISGGYLTTSFDGVSTFVLGEPDDVFGAMEFQPSQTYTTAGVERTYLIGTEDPGDNTVTAQSGLATLSSAGAISGTQDQGGPSGFQANQAISGIGPVSINSDGIGNVGPKTVAITNGTKLFFIDESGGPAVIKVLEK